MIELLADNHLRMPRGDSGVIRVTNPAIFKSGDKVIFAVRLPTRSEYEIYKEITEFNDGNAVIYLSNSDTKTLTTGKYPYDIRVVFADGWVDTNVVKGVFEIADTTIL